MKQAAKRHKGAPFGLLLIGLAILLIPNLLIWVWVYPGYFQADHQMSIAYMAAGEMDQWHSLFWQFLAYPLTYLSPSYGWYGPLQFAIFAAAVLVSLDRLWRLSLIGKRGFIGFLLLFALLPTYLLYNQLYSSDLIFAYTLLPLTVMCIEIAVSNGEALRHKRFLAGLIVLALIACLLRKNAMFIPVFLTIATVAFYPKARKAAVSFLAICLGSFAIINVVYSFVLDAESSPSQELLSVPSLQIARVYATGGEIPDAQAQYFESIHSREDWANAYTKTNGTSADEAKLNLELSGEFINNWIALGLANPKQYFMAYVQLMSPYWCLYSYSADYISVDFGAHDEFTLLHKEGLSDEYIAQFGNGHTDAQEKLPSLVFRVMNMHIPVLSDLFLLVLFSSAVPLWLIVAGCIISKYCRATKPWLVACVPIASVLLSLLIFSPIASFRYAVEMFYAIPVLVLFLCKLARRKQTLIPAHESERECENNRHEHQITSKAGNTMDQITSGNFTFTKTSIDGVIVVDVKAYGDTRGYFMETYKQPDFVKGGIDVDFVQDNQSSSTKGVLRGLHFQIEHPQSKLVRVVRGEVFDVAVDLREGSPTYGKWEGVILSEENHRQFFIPRGFAHGFLVLSDYAEFCYKCDDIYHPGDEGGLMWNDPAIGIDWPAMHGDDAFDPSKIVLSDKDKEHPAFKS